VPVINPRETQIMLKNIHAVVWIDHQEARIIRFDRDESDETIIHSEGGNHRLHIKAGTREGSRAPEDQHYFHHVAEALADARTVLIGGPANEKGELVKHLEKHDPAVAKRVAGVEPMDHLTDGELLAHARHFFKSADRM
jgi:stalled ribosome rescue protein Dom34